MKKNFAFLLLFALSVTLKLALPVQAGEVFTTNGVAIRGYDPVAYFTDNRAVAGKSEFAFRYRGAVFHFASAAHRDAFRANPARYAPQYGGFCAFAVSKGHKAPIEPEAFTVLQGKLYLNYNKAVMETWRKDPSGYIARADKNWERVKTLEGP